MRQFFGVSRRLPSRLIFSLHGITMIFWYAAPILSGFGNYLVPLMLGPRDMAFPRLNAFSDWMFLLSGLFLYGSLLLLQAPHAGWFAYVPLTNSRFSPGFNMDFFALSLILFTISQTAGAINFIVPILRLRAPGMALHRMPLFMYSTGPTAPESFARWLAHQREPAAAPRTVSAHRGQFLFLNRACSLCHTVRGTLALGSVAPDLTHLGSRRTLAAGSLPNDIADLHAWVLNAPALKPGVRMPALAQFQGDEIHDLVNYLRGLQ